jgi:hypothetical protein
MLQPIIACSRDVSTSWHGRCPLDYVYLDDSFNLSCTRNAVHRRIARVCGAASRLELSVLLSIGEYVHTSIRGNLFCWWGRVWLQQHRHVSEERIVEVSDITPTLEILLLPNPRWSQPSSSGSCNNGKYSNAGLVHARCKVLKDHNFHKAELKDISTTFRPISLACEHQGT